MGRALAPLAADNFRLALRLPFAPSAFRLRHEPVEHAAEACRDQVSD